MVNDIVTLAPQAVHKKSWPRFYLKVSDLVSTCLGLLLQTAKMSQDSCLIAVFACEERKIDVRRLFNSLLFCSLSLGEFLLTSLYHLKWC